MITLVVSGRYHLLHIIYLYLFTTSPLTDRVLQSTLISLWYISSFTPTLIAIYFNTFTKWYKIAAPHAPQVTVLKLGR